MSTDITAVAVVDASGAVVACGPGAAGQETAEAAGLLWDAASRRAAESGDAASSTSSSPSPAASSPSSRRTATAPSPVTGPRPAVALLLFDLRTCLGDAFAAGEVAQ